MKKFILLPLLLPFVFCQAQLRYKINTTGSCWLKNQRYFEKDNDFPKKLIGGHVIINDNNIVEICVEYSDIVKQCDKFQLTKRIEKPAKTLTTWEGKQIEFNGYPTELVYDVVITVENTSSSDITLYLCFTKNNTLGVYYICKKEY